MANDRSPLQVDELIIYKKKTAKREAVYSDFPEGMEDELKQFLQSQKITALYSHQAQMFETVQEGKNVVITTSTASGKTLSFLLPVISEILKNPLARAIFIYPTKALASDQYRSMEPFIEYFGAGRISAGVYDGDTPVNERSRIRKSANIILTNPEMVNGAFLPNHSSFGNDFIFSNLKFVVVDELHTYRGAFGSHLANVFKRLQRVCRYYRSSPQYLCSSATISNPLELAQEICGQPFMLIDQDGSPSPEKNYYIVQPPAIKGAHDTTYGRIPITSVASGLLPKLVVNRQSFIAFAKSRKNVEIILKETRDKLEAENVFSSSYVEKVSGYRGGYTPLERKDIEKRMLIGALTGLVSTNALELGIDIGKIGTSVLVGYPGTRASFWQQTGRAGRNGKACNNYLILDNLPFDQYIGICPDWLFEASSENAVIDKNNLLIQLAHVRAAAAELPLTLDDISLFPDLGEIIPVLMNAAELKAMSGKFAWSGNQFPAGDFSLRNIDKIRYKLLNKESSREITEMDELQAIHELHPGAVYMHEGVSFQVVSFDKETRTAYAITYNGNFYTQPMSVCEIKIIQSFMDQDYKRTHVMFGDINVNEMVTMYKKLQFHNHQNLGYEQLQTPLCKTYDTESTWIKVPDNVVDIFRRLLQPNQNGQLVRNNHFEGMCNAIKSAAMMVTMTAKDDIDVKVSNNALIQDEMLDDSVYIYIYDTYVGGLGYSEKIYDLIPKIITRAITLVSGCTCKDGCPACVGDYNLDRAVVLWGLNNLLEETEAPQSVKVAQYAKKPVFKKAFSIDDIEERWEEFKEMIGKSGDAFSAFLQAVPSVERKENALILKLDSPFYKMWVMEKENYRSILNTIHFYIDCPKDLTVTVKVEEENGITSKQNKLLRRYKMLKDENE